MLDKKRMKCYCYTKIIEQLIQFIEQNTFQAASGGSGKSRISILTVYVNPQTAQFIEGTTVVIATDK